MTDRQDKGFVESLLARARGDVCDLRPKLQPYYSAEPDGQELVHSEILQPIGTETLASRKPTSKARTVGGPRSAAGDSIESRDVSPLLAREDSGRTDQQASAGTTNTGVTTYSPPQPVIRGDAARVVRAPESIAPGPSSELVEASALLHQSNETSEPAFSLAAVLAKLESETKPTDFGAHARAHTTPRAAPVVQTPDQGRGSDPAELSPSDSPDAPGRPVHIHIDEIVIAPEGPLSAPPAQTRRPEPRWEPALSIDAYRAARERGER